jgi:hypothetical protein
MITVALLPRTSQETWKRGERYADQGRVSLTSMDKKSVEATVRGTETYTVTLAWRGSGISKSCTCPVGMRSEARHPPCKHMVAAAILWDERKGIQRPSPSEVDIEAISPPLVTRAQVNAMYRDPLHADLDVLRIAADEFNLSPREHARLPNMPKFNPDSSVPFTEKEAKSAFREIAGWTRRSAYHPWFCAGEMAAAFCDVLRTLFRRLPVTDALIAARVLKEARIFNEKLIMELIDDSEGEHMFTEAHLDEFYRLLKEREAPEVEQILQSFEEHR